MEIDPRQISEVDKIAKATGNYLDKIETKRDCSGAERFVVLVVDKRR